jgi:hypothetical protein
LIKDKEKESSNINPVEMLNASLIKASKEKTLVKRIVYCTPGTNRIEFDIDKPSFKFGDF